MDKIIFHFRLNATFLVIALLCMILSAITLISAPAIIGVVFVGIFVVETARGIQNHDENYTP